MAKKEMTKREKIQYIMTLPCILEDNIAREYLEHELELLDSRKGSEEKRKEKEDENARLKNAVLEVLTANKEKEGMTATEIQRSLDEEITCQRAVSILRILVSEDIVTRFTCKKVPYFTLKKEGI